MTVQLNGQEREVPDGISVEQLVRLFGAAPEGVAVAIDGEVVPRGQHPLRTLHPGARVEVIRAVGGG